MSVCHAFLKNWSIFLILKDYHFPIAHMWSYHLVTILFVVTNLLERNEKYKVYQEVGLVFEKLIIQLLEVYSLLST